MIRRAAAILAIWPMGVAAQSLDMPSNASQRFSNTQANESRLVLTAPWQPDGLTGIIAEGTLQTDVWRIDAAALTTFQVLRPLREQLLSAGYTILFECETAACGGFDFRFALDVVGPPQMQVNLGDFRYLVAQGQQGDAQNHVTILASRTARAGFVQIDRIGETARQTTTATSAPVQSAQVTATIAAVAGDIAAALDTIGRAQLDDLEFPSGSAQLGDGTFPSLVALAAYLGQYPDRKVALVGHTDASGSLDANIALSKRRAGSVLERLVSQYGVNRQQLDAQGMGYLAPIANNLTPEGREANRRVEVIVTSTNID